MADRLWFPRAFWLGALGLGVLANLYLWWPQIGPVPHGDCTDIRTVLLSDGLSRQDVRAVLGRPSAESGIYWSYSRLCVDSASGMVTDVAVLFRGDTLYQVVY